MPLCIVKSVKSLLHVQKVRKFVAASFCRKRVNVTDAKRVNLHVIQSDAHAVYMCYYHAGVEVTFIYILLFAFYSWITCCTYSAHMLYTFNSFVLHFNLMNLAQYFHIGELNSSFSSII